MISMTGTKFFNIYVMLIIIVTIFCCNGLNVPLNTDGIWSSMSTGYSKIRKQGYGKYDDYTHENPIPVVQNDLVRDLLRFPELAAATPESRISSIFVRPFKNFRKVNFPDEIKK